jgi:RNA polymerase sigma-70 factor (ECF subfamily)
MSLRHLDLSDQPAAPPTACNPERWVELHADALFRFALLRVRNQTTAEELVQETFVAALSASAAFRAQGSERTWLVGILKHKIIDQFRKSQREQPTDTALAESDPVVEKAFTKMGRWKIHPRKCDIDPAALMENAEFWEAFTGCVGALPEKMAQAFSMRMLNDEEPDTVCQVLAITPTNLWMLLHRARARLRQCLEAKWFCNDREPNR